MLSAGRPSKQQSGKVATVRTKQTSTILETRLNRSTNFPINRLSMGQESSKYPPAQGLQLGTYRIVSGIAGTAIEISRYNHNEVVAWSIHEEEHQQWFLQESGDGYIFKNRRHGSFLSVAHTSMHARVYSSRYPTTWVLRRRGDHYLIQYPDNNLVLDLHFGKADDGNKIHLQPGDDLLCKTWKLELLSNHTGETPPQVNGEVNRLEEEINALQDKISEKDEALAQCRGTVRELQGSCEGDDTICKQCNSATVEVMKLFKFEYPVDLSDDQESWGREDL